MEKRSAERLMILGELDGEIMAFQPMRIANMSRGGATVETAFPLHLDSLHDLRLTLGETSLVVKARVVHSRISDVEQDLVVYRSGVEFVDLPDRAAAAIAAFIEAMANDRM
jgi:hypothetical protein